MSKKLAIKGHSTRSKEVIELLEMMGGSNIHKHIGNNDETFYYINGKNNIDCDWTLWNNNHYAIFTLEEFLKKFSYKVGDVIKFPNNMAEEIAEMKWDEELEDIIYTSVSGWTRPCHVPKNTNNKTNMETDCKKCGLHFGSVRCFDKDCPHNKPKSYAVGLKDGEVIECGVNKEIGMNEIKPLFKSGDVVKLKGCPDKNIFWIVMDVVKDGYIFNDGKKYSFDDQHHYEKTNIQVINIQPEITAKVTDKNNCDIECPCGYEFYDENDNLIGTKVLMRRKKAVYPKTYEECKEMLEKDVYYGFTNFMTLQKLIICRDVYWKIYGEQMGLKELWEPDWKKQDKKYIISVFGDTVIYFENETYNRNTILAFPTEEMRDAFYENFKDLIEQCKELL